MSAHFPDRECRHEQVVDLAQLPLDLRRVLTVQFKEFIHRIEDVQNEHDLPHNPHIVRFLERCLREAA